MERPQFVQSIVNWLRAGYPEGVPQTDYVPLLGLLRRQVSDDEAKLIASELIEEGNVDASGHREPISKIDAGVLITKVINELPEERDIDRVRARLERKGWPFDEHPLETPKDEGPNSM